MDKARYLFLEVADGVLVRIGEEVEDFVLYVILLQVVHQMSPVTLRPQQRGISKTRPAKML